ncbi:GNAT family N-acetyltransferase [Polycladidibacter stylochi]|uniref:GNAT family N-acetyltransferase n=1 Tax=Polycladidibacter stylochi TaxID=1807766 RepID=UPI0008300194|nr:GNAT family N-acetyltransferase [Pseudovibrio stylochi]
MHYNIRVAVFEDLEALVALVNGGATAGRVVCETKDMTVYATALQEILKAPEVDIYVLVSEKGELIATCQLTLSKGLAFSGKPRATLESMHTKAAYRGMGYGHILLQYLKEKAKEKGCCLIQLTSNSERKDAHRFYQREGFVPSHVGFKMQLDDRKN